MAIGLATVTSKASIDGDIGRVALALRKVLAQLEELHHYFLITPDATLKALGYSDGTGTNPVNEIAIIKSAFTDGDTLFQIATGNATWPAAQSLMLNLDQLAGDLLVTQ